MASLKPRKFLCFTEEIQFGPPSENGRFVDNGAAFGAK
jgi:hypothetical protein